ncbi:hypothetical protein K438DRAFT_1844343 [Mycena galopus ATCC 62051]|nr:hypothetical protein K438DRAFT_1844343 [Mycena galopus ATCC 62051]
MTFTIIWAVICVQWSLLTSPRLTKAHHCITARCCAWFLLSSPNTSATFISCMFVPLPWPWQYNSLTHSL